MPAPETTWVNARETHRRGPRIRARAATRLTTVRAPRTWSAGGSGATRFSTVVVGGTGGGGGGLGSSCFGGTHLPSLVIDWPCGHVGGGGGGPSASWQKLMWLRP